MFFPTCPQEAMLLQQVSCSSPSGLKF
uniref:Uncharacterized protein n=1 Tax=Arundo donax TaxID=35708 RepID=A0A0A9G580_ARUDO